MFPDASMQDDPPIYELPSWDLPGRNAHREPHDPLTSPKAVPSRTPRHGPAEVSNRTKKRQS